MFDREQVLELMTQAQAVYLATIDGPLPRIRALSNLRRSDLYPASAAFCRAEGFTCYLATSAASSKAAQLRSHPEASLYYSDPDSVRGIMLSGRMEILTDQQLKNTLWDDAWRIYWSGPADPDYIVLRLKPVEASGWWGARPFRLNVEDL